MNISQKGSETKNNKELLTDHNKQVETRNIWDLPLSPECTAMTNPWGCGRQPLLLLTVFTFTCSDGSNIRQLSDRCHPPTRPAAGTLCTSPLSLLSARSEDLHQAELRKTVNRGSISKCRLGRERGGASRGGRGGEPAYATKPGAETCSLFSFTSRNEISRLWASPRRH